MILSIHLIDIIELALETNNFECAIDYQVLLTSLTLSLIESGNDPRNALDTILRTIEQISDQSIDDSDIFDFILITMSQIIHKIPPFYLGSALSIVKVSNITEKKSRNFKLNLFGFIFLIYPSSLK